MKQIIKLAELNAALTMSQRALIVAERSVPFKSFDEQYEATWQQADAVKLAESNLKSHLASKRLENEFSKYQERKDEVRAALIAVGYDTAVMDFF